MSVWYEPETCLLCGHSARGEIKMGLIERPANPPGMRYEHVPRCIDRTMCRARVEAAGREWEGERVG